MGRKRNADKVFNADKALKKKSATPVKKAVSKTKAPLKNKIHKVSPRGDGIKKMKLDDGTPIDINSYGLGDTDFTDEQKLFIIWYITPCTPAYHVAAEAARRAGSKAAPNQLGFHYLKNDKIASFIKDAESFFDKVDVNEEYHRIIEMKKKRIHFDVGEFYKQVPVTDKDGNQLFDINGKPVTQETTKDLSELTPEQRELIDCVDYKSQLGIRAYQFPERSKEMSDFIKMHTDMTKTADSSGYDVETTAEIIKGRLQVKTKVIQKNNEIGSKAVDFEENNEGKIEEE